MVIHGSHETTVTLDVLVYRLIHVMGGIMTGRYPETSFVWDVQPRQKRLMKVL